jgi:hypothetical protein
VSGHETKGKRAKRKWLKENLGIKRGFGELQLAPPRLMGRGRGIYERGNVKNECDTKRMDANDKS